jgi:uroporphyrinogen-III synthase
MKQLIVITRPAHQTRALARGIKAAGGEVVVFPTLDIIPAPLSDENKKLLLQLNEVDIIIFISPNAVEHGLTQIQSVGKLPDSIQLATIGQGSAKSLHERLGKQPDIVPDENFNSEGLLANAALQNVADKRILIIRGDGGREHLKQTLLQRGARVDYLNVYQRIKPAKVSGELEQHLQNKRIAAIVITSAEGLKNMLEMVDQSVQNQLLHIPLLLINQRLVASAKDLGFKGDLFIATQASDNAIIETLQQNHLLS